MLWSANFHAITNEYLPFTFAASLLDNGYYTLTGEVFDAKGTQIGKVTSELRKVAPAKEEIYVENNGIMINGHPFFPIGLYALTKEDFATVRKAGFNFIFYNSSHNNMTVTLAEADQAAKYGMRMWWSAGHSMMGGSHFPGTDKTIPPPVLPINLSKEQLQYVEKKTREEILLMKDHPALLSWWHSEESDLPGIVPERLSAIYRELDPYHPLAASHNNGDTLGTYKKAFEIFNIWSYPGFFLTHDTERISEVTSRLSLLWNKVEPNACVFIDPQTHIIGWWAARSDFSQRQPNYREIRNMTYQGIVNGVKGVIYIYYKHDNCGTINSMPGMWNGMVKTVKELQYFTNAICLGENIQGAVIEKGKEAVHILLKKYNGDYYLFTVSTSMYPQDAIIKISDPAIKNMQVVSENRSINIKNGGFSDHFDKFETHIYTTSLQKFDLQTTKFVEDECATIQQSFENAHRMNLASWYLGSKTEPAWGALIDNDTFTSCIPHSTFRGVFKLPFPIDVLFSKPQTVGKIVLKCKNLTLKDIELYYNESGEWKAIPATQTQTSETKTKDFTELHFTFSGITTDKIRTTLLKTGSYIFEIEAYKN